MSAADLGGAARPARIGLDVWKVLWPRDGIGTYVLNLLRSLMATDRERQYLLYALGEPGAAETFRRLFPDCPPNFRLAAGAWPRPGEVDLFHATSWSRPATPGRRVLTVYDLTFLTHPELHLLANKVHCAWGTVGGLLDGAHLIAISRHGASQLGELLGVPPSRIDVIYPGLDPAIAPIDHQQACRRVVARWRIEAPFVLFVGTLEPRKNLGRLLDAYAALPAELGARHPLVVAGGRGWLDGDLRHRLARSGLPRGRVRLLGRVSDAELAELYSATAAFVYPSLAEGFGLPVLEALACGAPVLTSGVTALPEVAGEAALACDPLQVTSIRDALARLLGSPELALDLRRRGPERARLFTWERAARATADLYSRLLAR